MNLPERKSAITTLAGMPLRPLLIRFALIYLIAVAILSSAIWVSLSLNARTRLDEQAKREQGRLQVALHRLERDLLLAESELRLTANLRSMQSYLNTDTTRELGNVAQNFLAVSRTTGRYDQVRYLNAAGREILRVNYNNGRPALVPPDQLQDKSGRYYFRDTIGLGPGEIYISPLDLNIEEGRLELPYKPMVRFGMPLFDDAGQKKGILVFNYFASELLRHFRETMSGGDPRNAMLLNRDGYWLSSKHPEDEWGFMLGDNKRTFGHAFPDAWRTIASSEQGKVETHDGLFVYTTFYPLGPGLYSSTGTPEAGAPSQRTLQPKEYHWKLVSFVPHSVLVGQAFYAQPAGRILLLTLYFLLGAGAAVIAYIGTSRNAVRVALQENEKRLREITSTLSEGVLVMDQNGRITFVNPEACATLGYPEAELLGQDMHDYLHAGLNSETPPARADCTILQVMRKGTSCRVTEDAFRRKDGTLLPVAVSAAPIINRSGIGGVVVAFHDITERKRAELALRNAAAEIEDLYNNAPCGYHSLDAEGRFSRINQTELRWLGYRRDELIGKAHFTDLLTPDSQQLFCECFPRFTESGQAHNYEFEVRRKDGSILPVLASATAVLDENGQFLMSRSTLFDLTERKKMERALELQARTDALTGLNNRRHFFELAQQELTRAHRHAEPLALLMLDLDHFKAVNDNYGHHAGDLALRKMSEVCAHVIRDIDVAARLGGEEFAVLLPQTPEEEAREVAERLRLAVAAATVQLDSTQTLQFTVSIGLAMLLAAPDDNLDNLLRRADGAMYHAKQSGRNRVRVAAPT